MRIMQETILKCDDKEIKWNMVEDKLYLVYHIGPHETINENLQKDE